MHSTAPKTQRQRSIGLGLTLRQAGVDGLTLLEESNGARAPPAAEVHALAAGVTLSRR